tara:strand:+ start:68 stop:226 length:159 start_codon:yes stop_codon:yes gene_type:complete
MFLLISLRLEHLALRRSFGAMVRGQLLLEHRATSLLQTTCLMSMTLQLLAPT